MRHRPIEAPENKGGLSEKIKTVGVLGLLRVFWGLRVIRVIVGVIRLPLAVSLAHRYAVFIFKVRAIHLEVVEDHFFVGLLLLWRVVDGIIPVESQILDRKAKLHHPGQQLAVDDVTQFVGIFLDQVLEYLEVCL